MGKTAVTTHPSVESLAQFQKSPDNLSREERQAIQGHLQTCPACREEVKLLASFDFSLVQKWAAGTKEAAQVERVSLIVRLFDALRSLVLHPAFAYGIALLLGLPLLRSYYSAPSYRGSSAVQQEAAQEKFAALPPSPALPEPEVSVSAGVPAMPTARLKSRETEPAANSESQWISTASRSIGLVRQNSPEVAFVLLDNYRAVYEKRDVEALGRLWQMDSVWRDYLTQLFVKSRRVALLLDVDKQSVEVKSGEQQVSVPFAQVVTAVDQEGRFSTHGPFFCIADIRYLSSGAQVIQNMREDPRHRGQCHPKE
jgi:hypothetical protein